MARARHVSFAESTTADRSPEPANVTPIRLTGTQDAEGPRVACALIGRPSERSRRGVVVALAAAVACASTACAARARVPADAAHAGGSPPVPQQAQRSFIVPAVEIVVMDILVNIAARRVMTPEHFEVSLASIRRNLRGPWVVDDDPFEVNQFLHPYQGAMYHGIARSSGLNYWQSVAYTFAGSALWEIAGETTSPSKNDQIASGIAGSFLGEPLFRTSRLILVKGGDQPGFLRALAATIVSPPSGVNRLLFGDRFHPDAPGEMPFADLRLELGVTVSLTDLPRRISSRRATTPFVGFAIDYGFPGVAPSTHSTPFDSFRLEGIASSGGFQNLAARGLIAGQDYGAGVRGRGIWGLYGGYDYFAPGIFRVSSTNASLGTTAQSHLGALTLHATALLGIGYTAAQTVADGDEGDYHYGIAPQGLISLRAIAGRRASLDLSAREYLISDIGGFGTSRRDRVLRGDATMALRIAAKHGLAIKYLWSERRETPRGLPRLTQPESTVGLFYTFLGSGGFGANR